MHFTRLAILVQKQYCIDNTSLHEFGSKNENRGTCFERWLVSLSTAPHTVQHIEMDSKGLLDMNQVNCSSTWKLYYIITDCKPTISSQINVAQSYREGNQVADSMAAYGHQVHFLTVLNDHTQLSGMCKPVLYGQAVICL